jgi:hypothetical protein
MRRTLPALSILLLLSVSTALADPPALKDLTALFKTGDYAAVLKGCDDALAPGGSSDPAERYGVACLKGEAQLRLGNADEAVSAFNAAVELTQDTRQQAIAKATAILITRSKNLIYTSITIKPPPNAKLPPAPAAPALSDATTHPAYKPPGPLPRGQYDIVDPVRRIDALAALWADERADAETTIKQQIASKDLAQIAPALTRVNAAEPIAIAAGNADWAQAHRTQLATAAKIDANSAMRDMNLALVPIVKSQAKRRASQHPKSMPQDQRDQINKMTQSLDVMTTTLKALTDQLHLQADYYNTQRQQAASLQDRATTVLATD